MKRLFTFAIIALIATLTFAQLQYAKRTPRTAVEKVLQGEQLSSRSYTDAVAKANANDEKNFSRLVRSTNPAVGYQQLNITELALPSVKLDRTASSSVRYSAPAKATETVGNVTITTDAHGIITDVTGVEPRIYTRATSGTAYYSNNNSMDMAAQSGTATIIIDGNNVYMLNPVSRYTQDTWVKGTMSGNTITVPTHQPLYYASNYSTTVSLRWGVITAAGNINAADATADAFTFTVDGDVIALNGTAAYDGTANAPFMGVFWDDDNTTAGYGDAETVLTYDPGYVAPSTELVELPAGVTAESWYLNGTNVTSSAEAPILNKSINVAIVGSDVYVQGLFDAFPTSWIKGKINFTSVEFEKLQYLGKYGNYDVWFIGVNPQTGDILNATGSYNLVNKTITLNTDVLANAAADRIYYLQWIADAVLSVDQIAYDEPVLNDQTTTLPYLNTFDTAEEQNEVAIYDANDDNSTFSYEKPVTSENNYAARYRYSTTNTADDYLVFPAMELEAGISYVISADVRSYSSRYPEKVTVLCGKEPKISALDTEVIPVTEVATDQFFTISNGSFQVAETGMYTFAVKAVSNPDMFYLWVDNFSVAANNPAAPVAAEDFAVVPDATGASKATLIVTAPAKTVSGDAISGDLKMTVKVNGEVNVVKTVQPGESVTEEISLDAPGTYTFSVLFESADGVSDAATVKSYIGVDAPDDVRDLTLADKSIAVDMSWLAPAGGVNGGIFFPENCKYNVYPVEMVEFLGMTFPSIDYSNPYVTGLTETTYLLPFDTNEGPTQYTYFAVSAENEAGESDGTLAALVTGAPISLPVKESLVDGALHYWWGTASDEENYDLEGGLYIGKNASDGDEYNFEFIAYTGGWMTLESAKIALAGAANPVVKFDVMNTLGNGKLEVSVITTEGQTLLTTITPADMYTPQVVSLADYKNADWVRVIFKGVFEGNEASSGDPIGIIDLDNIQIVNYLDHNLVVTGFNAPTRVNAGGDIVATLSVQNQGSMAVAADDYTVKFTVNGAETILDGVALGVDEKTEFTLTVPTTVVSPAEFVIAAEVVYAADEDNSNNAADEVTVKVVTPNYPVPTDLTATVQDATISLAWNEPNTEAAPAEPVTEDFEDADAFSATYGDWTFVDGDQSEVGGFQDMDLPGIDPGTTKGSFWVWDQETIGGNQTFDAHSGTKYLFALFRYDDGTTDDWAISPELDGSEQTISFYAKSYSSDYPEKIEIYYSTGSTEPSDFVKVANVGGTVPGDWTLYEATVPAGATRFAIRSCATGSFMLMVDDVTYIPAGVGAALELVGYNVYRNGVKINDAVVEECNYTDANVEEGSYEYVVTAVYTKGESAASNVATATVVTVGLDAAFAAGVNVTVADHNIVITGAAGMPVAVYATDGKAIYSGVGAAKTIVPAMSGVYVVKAADTVKKVLVK